MTDDEIVDDADEDDFHNHLFPLLVSLVVVL